MSALVLPNRFKQQPQKPAPIDYAGLGKGIRLLLNPALGLRDLVTGTQWAYSGTSAPGVSEKGRVFSYPGTDDRLIATGYPDLTGNVGTLALWCPVVGNLDTYGVVLLGSSSPSLFAPQIIGEATAINIPGMATSTGPPLNWFNTKNTSIVLSFGGTSATQKAFLNGKDTNHAWTGGDPNPFGAGNKTLWLGGYPGGGGWDFQGSILLCLWTDAVWGSAESNAFHENPWQLFKAPPRRLWAVSAGGSPISYTISPSGGILLDGNGDYLRGKIFLPSGSVSLSGGSVLARGREYSPTGGITFSGTAPIGTASSFLIVPEGGVVLSGVATQSGSHSYEVSPSGGINLSGTSPIASGSINSYTLYPSGGLTASGTALIIKTHIYLPSGGIAFAGGSPMSSNTRVIIVTTHKTLTGVGI